MPNFHLPSEQNNFVLHNARIIDPATSTDLHGSLWIENGKIKAFGDLNLNDIDSKVERMDCNGQLLVPGLIDLQVHFRDPGQSHKEDVTTGSMSAVAGGVTAVVCQPNTNPTLDSAEVIKALYDKAKQQAYCNVYTYASITKNLKGGELVDFEALAKAGAVGFTDDGLPLMNSQLMRECMERAKALGLVVAQHCEDLNITNKGCINEGAVSRQLGVPGIPNISESIIVERDLAILGLTGGHYHVLHVSTREAMEAIMRAKDKGLNVTCEVCPHHFTLTDEAVLKHGTLAKMNPPLRSEADRQFLIEAMKQGYVDAITTDHAPHDPESKNKPLTEATFGIVGLETFLPLSLELVWKGELELMHLLKMMTAQAADIVGIDAGRIAVGATADLALIDLDHEWVIDSSKFHSKSKNAPFDGMAVKGRVTKTFTRGSLVYTLN